MVGSDEPMLWGGELILRDGAASGQVMSAAWGESLGACVGLAYVWDAEGGTVDRDWVGRGGFEVDVSGVTLAGDRIAATAVRPRRGRRSTARDGPSPGG